MTTTRTWAIVAAGVAMALAALVAGCGPAPEETCDVMLLREAPDAVHALAGTSLAVSLSHVSELPAGSAPSDVKAQGARIPQATDTMQDGPNYWLHADDREAEFWIRVTHGPSGAATWYGPVGVLPGGRLVARRR